MPIVREPGVRPKKSLHIPFKNKAVFYLFIFLVCACTQQQQYPVAPQIDLLKIVFKKGTHTQIPPIPDTLIFNLKFKDGDDDLGVIDASAAELMNPIYYAYNPTSFVVLRGVSPEAVPIGFKLINYKAKRTLAIFDTLPSLNCVNWEIRGNCSTGDTVYVMQNPKTFNIGVDVFFKDASGTYSLDDPAKIESDLCHCRPNLFRGTFPDLTSQGNSTVDGTMTFRIQSYYLSSLLSGHTLKFSIKIMDRAFHQSNVITKQDFTLRDITN